jgi:hypothetical protein
LAACATASYSGPCPPWPVAGPNVAEELDNVPFNGFTAAKAAIADLERDINALPDGGQKAALLADLAALKAGVPTNDFADFWNWVARLRTLKRQLDFCRGADPS